MTFREYKNLISKGVEIATRDENSFRFILYQLDEFYIEVEYWVSFNFITRFSIFTDTQRLEPYLKQLDLDLNSLQE